MGDYQFIPFPHEGREVNRAKRAFACHDRRIEGAWFGKIIIEIVCDQPVHIGSGFKVVENEREVVRRTARSGEKIIIPGSTFKGVIRARFEAITKSCAGDPPDDRAPIKSRSYPNIHRGRLTPAIQGLAVFGDSCGKNGETCSACALFGYQSRNGTLRSRISFEDLVSIDNSILIADMPQQFEPRLHHLGYGDFDYARGEFKLHSIHGRKFYIDADNSRRTNNNELAEISYERVEIIPEGARLCGAIRFSNLETAELGALLIALGIEPESYIKIGGGKAYRFGNVFIEDVRYQLRDARGIERNPDLAAWQKAFHESPDYWEEGEKQLVKIHQEVG